MFDQNKIFWGQLQNELVALGGGAQIATKKACEELMTCLLNIIPTSSLSAVTIFILSLYTAEGVHLVIDKASYS